MTCDVLYATMLVPAAVASERIRHQRQSLAAQDLLEKLQKGIKTTATSKSHSRTAIAVAASNATSLSLGIDIELMAPNRPFDALGRSFLTFAPTPLGMDAFYRCWTFGEAYFKAFQRLPTTTIMQEFIGHVKHTGVFRLTGDVYVMQKVYNDLFRLCLVWQTGASEECSVRQVPIGTLHHEYSHQSPSSASDKSKWANTMASDSN